MRFCLASPREGEGRSLVAHVFFGRPGCGALFAQTPAAHVWHHRKDLQEVAAAAPGPGPTRRPETAFGPVSGRPPGVQSRDTPVSRDAQICATTGGGLRARRGP